MFIHEYKGYSEKFIPKKNSEMINDENQKLPNRPRNNIQRRIP